MANPEDADKIALLRLLIGDSPSSPFYPLFTEDELQQFLDLTGGDVFKAARWAAISASMTISSFNTREETGDILVWNEYAKNYLIALKFLLSSSDSMIPQGLMPWAGGISRAEACAWAKDPDLLRSALLTIQICDGDDVCGDSRC